MGFWQWFQFIFSFAIVIGLAYFVSRLLSQKVLPGKQKNIRLIENMSLGGRRFLTLIEVRGQVLLLGVTDHTIVRLADLTNGQTDEGVWLEKDIEQS